MQHAAGYILFEDVRDCAIDQIPASATQSERAVAIQAINDALYGLMQVIDGVTGAVRNGDSVLELRMSVRLRNKETITDQLDLSDGDGMCMGYHWWLGGDFGPAPIVDDRAAPTS